MHKGKYQLKHEIQNSKQGNIFHRKQTRKHGTAYVKVWKSTTGNEALHSFAKLSLRINGDIKTIQKQNKLRRFMTTKPALQKSLRGNYTQRKKEDSLINENTEKNTFQNLKDETRVPTLSTFIQCSA